MQVTAAFLCDFAEIREGLLFALGGGITRLWRAQFPAGMEASLALLLELHVMELGSPHEIHVLVQDQDGGTVGEIKGSFQTRAPDLEPGESTLVPVVLDLRGGTIQAPGPHQIEIAVDGQHRRSIGFRALPASERPGPSPAQ